MTARPEPATGTAAPPVDLSLGVIAPELFAAEDAGRSTLAVPPALLGRYSPRGGLPLLRQAVAAIEAVAAEQVTITTGASMALTASVATLPAGATILLPRPGFPAYANIARFLGRPVAWYDLLPPADPVQSIRQALAEQAAGAVVINTPGNPLGNLLSIDQVAAIRRLTIDAGCALIIDETYAGLIFDDPEGTAWQGQGRGLNVGPDRAAGAGDDVIRILSFSKQYRLAGARLGYAIASPNRIRRIEDVHWTLAMSAPVDAQIHAASALAARQRLTAAPDIAARLRGLADRAIRHLAPVGALRIVPPRAGPVMWLELPGFPGDSTALAGRCAREAGVLVVPGLAFGVASPPAIRCCFAVPEPVLDQAFGRLAALMDQMDPNQGSRLP
ncbi:pyridoxal phosphate-dependent aminotransferase [Tistrella sp. BH-R2-4]|uniref:aspartate transaminase n=1 Tax=Tistrella arctica TaxID=3133430 RepID=A0ABU9YH67_9PROT